MKKLILAGILALSAMLANAAPGDAANKTTLTFSWDASDTTEDISGYRLYARTNIAVGSWLFLTNVTGGSTTNVTVALSSLPGWPAQRGPCFFMLTATNLMGESDPSNVVSIPKLPSSGAGFKIKAVN